MSKHEILKINPAEAASLIDALDDYASALYPAESNHLDSLDTLSNKNVTMIGAMEGETILAIGAVKAFKDYGEIKRVFVPAVHRGKGLAKMIMAALEQILIDRSIGYAKLETGIHQHEAIGLYHGLGYHDCPPFGPYRPDPLSVFMSKQLFKEE